MCCVLCELCESLLALEWCKSWGVAGVKAASDALIASILADEHVDNDSLLL